MPSPTEQRRAREIVGARSAKSEKIPAKIENRQSHHIAAGRLAL
jgi:hypothetical protein